MYNSFLNSLDSLAPYVTAAYVFLSVLSLGMAIHFFRKKARPNKPTYVVYTTTLCIFLQQMYVVVDSIFLSDQDYRWALMFLYFGVFHIINVASIALVIKNFASLRLSSVQR